MTVCYLDPDRYGPWRFQVKCVSYYWDLKFRNGDGFGAVEGLHKWEDSGVFH